VIDNEERMMIDIVLATFNGELYLEEQIKSIQNNHHYKEFVSCLMVVDDGSTDSTEDIVAKLATYDAKIQWLSNTSGKHGAKENFSFGLSQTQSQYVMLSDQDDVWQLDKIALSMNKIKQLESDTNQPSEKTPLLVFSDKEIVDENLQLISSSYFKLKNISKDWYLSFDQLCQQNVISGCTMLFNRALIKQATPVPEQAYMHDWWLAIVASRCGKVALIDKPLIKYRQHSNNTIGANQRSKFNLLIHFSQHLKRFEKSFFQIVEQAKAFEAFEKEHDLTKNRTISVLANLNSFSKSQKLRLFVNKTINRSHLFGRIALLIVLLRI